MRKLTFIFIAILFTETAMAGGIITNTNQSAMFTRMLARDATLGIDATYYNPAGLTLLPNDGFFLSINNQTLGQTRIITSDYMLLNESEYTGKISAPFFPGIYTAYKFGNFVLSAGFNPIAGGGAGTYDTGLPSFEYLIADLVPSLRLSLLPIDQGIEDAIGTNPGFSEISGYQADIYFEGTSVFFGYQANVSYKINEIISVALGGRYVSAKETFKGSLANIQIMAPVAYGGLQPAGTYLRTVAMTPGLDPTTVTTLEGTADVLDIVTADKEVDVEKTANGFTPIISLHIKPGDKFDLALKYEHNTKLEFTTKVNDGKDGNGIYTDGEKSRLDIPAQLVAGITYRPIEPLLISTGFHYYFDKQADWNGRDTLLDGNSIEWALGLEYAISKKFSISAGYLYTNTAVSPQYQTDLDYNLASNTGGAGLAFRLNPMIEINLGGG